MCEINSFPSPVIDKKHPHPLASVCVFDYQETPSFSLLQAICFRQSRIAFQGTLCTEPKVITGKEAAAFLQGLFDANFVPDILFVDVEITYDMTYRDQVFVNFVRNNEMALFRQKIHTTYFSQCFGYQGKCAQSIMSTLIENTQGDLSLVKELKDIERITLEL